MCLPNSKSLTLDLTRNEDLKYNGTNFVYTLEGPFRNGDTTINVPCPHGGRIEIICVGADIIKNFAACSPAPKCGAQEINLGPLKGSVNVEEIFAGESVRKSCPINSEATVKIDCDVFGEWMVADDSECNMGPCGDATFVKDGIRFSIGETSLNTLSVTKCYHALCSNEDGCPILDMCSDGSCGSKLCNPAVGGLVFFYFVVNHENL